MIKESRRNLFVIHHSLRTFLVASVLSAIVNLLNTTIDGIVVSQRVSADAISVVVLVEPVITIVQLFGTMLFSGASLLVASAYGNQQFKLVNRLVTMSLTSVFILNGLLALVCCLFSEQIAHLLTDEERLLPLVTDYLPFTLAGCVVWMVCDAVGRYVKVSGRPKLVTNYVVLDTLLNLAFDLLLVVALDMGMQGAAIAGVISSILAMVVFVPYLSKPPRPFAFDRAKGCYLNLLGKSFQRGIPTAIAAFIMAVLYMSLNYIVLHTQGADGMYILSVCLQTLNFALILSFAANSAVKYIGGMMYGERDWEGLNRTLTSIVKIVQTACIVAMVLLYLFPDIMPTIYGADERLRQLSQEPVRLFSQSMIPISLLMLLSNIYMMSDRSRLSSVIEFGPLIIMLPIVWLIATIIPDYLWYSIPLGLWILLLITVVGIYLVSRKGEHLHWLFLTPTDVRQGTYSISIPFSESDVKSKLTLLQRYIVGTNPDQSTLISIQHCIEELVYHELEMGLQTGRTGAFDISIQNQPERLSVIIKDVGKAYNPQLAHHATNNEDIDENKFYMSITQHYCKDIIYQYKNGLNCLYLNFPK